MNRRPQRPCSQPHGTFNRYVSGCSCLECCNAWAAYQAERKAEATPRLVDVAPVRAHLRELYAKGMSRGSIAASAFVSYGTLRIIDGSQPVKEGRYTTTCRRETAEAIMELSACIPGDYSGWIPVAQSKRLVARMRKQGMTLQDVSNLCGVSRTGLKDIIGRNRRISGRNAKAILDAARKCGAARTPADQERYVALRSFNGYSQDEAMRELGISHRVAARFEEAIA